MRAGHPGGEARVASRHRRRAAGPVGGRLSSRERHPRTLKLTLAYDGRGLVGWQRQAEGTSVQGLLETALARIEGAPVTVIGAGRTDAGVHASGQVASVELTAPIDPHTLVRALNAVLPSEVRVMAADDVASSFHARYSAASKTYRYQIVNGPIATPFEWRYAWHVPDRLDFERMRGAAALFEGEHDFAAFRATGSDVKTSVRRVCESRLLRATPDAGGTTWCSWGAGAGVGDRLVYQVTANGFLRHMVRAMVGTLVEIGAGRREAESIERALRAGTRTDAGPTAPACGLWLVRVDYP